MAPQFLQDSLASRHPNSSLIRLDPASLISSLLSYIFSLLATWVTVAAPVSFDQRKNVGELEVKY